MVNQLTRPFFSVIMNCYNGERYLRRALDSVYFQTCVDWEIIFVDNASTDNSRGIAEAYLDKLKYYRLPQLLPYGYARKYAVEQARGTWITFLDVDDFWESEKLEVQYKQLYDSNFVACYAGYYSVDIEGKVFGVTTPKYESGFIFGDQLRQFEVSTVTMALKRDCLIDNNISYNGELASSADDNVVLRLLTKGTCCVLKQPLAYYTVSENSLSAREINNWASDRFVTAIQLKSENLDLELYYSSQFSEYLARAHYYYACYSMHSQKYTDARQSLIEACNLRKSYYIFLLLSFVPYVWSFLHQPKVKFMMSKVYFKFAHRQ